MIRKTLYKLLRWVQSEENIVVESKRASNGLARSSSDNVEVEGMRFTLMRANGGIILQSRTYDRRKDENNTNTYLITDDEPLADRIGQIVSLEMLRNI
jgi:hypothetical protein